MPHVQGGSMRSLLLLFLVFSSTPIAAATIYLCKTNQGASYWASDWCSKTGGYTVNAVTVPNGMDFKEQARLADQYIGAQQVTAAREDASVQRARRCGAIDNELAQIWSRYNNWQFNEVNQIGRDQTRTRELNAERHQLACQTK
jgi:hypothetical protein